MKIMKILSVVGARPNFMKIAPIHKRMIKDLTIDPILVHTGQHFDEEMSKKHLWDKGGQRTKKKARGRTH